MEDQRSVSSQQDRKSKFNSLNEKMLRIERMLKEVKQEDDEDNEHLQQLINKSKELEMKALHHVGRCDSMKNLLVRPSNDDTLD